MNTNQKRGCCGACIIPLATLGFCIWILVKPKTPNIYVEQFTVFALNNKNFDNNTIHYDLRLRNRNYDDIGIYYDALNLTFYYQPRHNNFSSFPIEIGNATFAPFYQGRFRSKRRGGNIDAVGVKWENVTAPVMFKVELTTSVRYRKPLWKSKRRHVAVEASLEINDQGNLAKKGIKLHSLAGRNYKSRYELASMIATLIFIHFW